MDEIVSATQFQDMIVIFCRSGKIYQMSYNPNNGGWQFRFIHELVFR